MKTLAVLATLIPAQMGVLPQIENPAFMCREDGYCLIRAELLKEIIHAPRSLRCQGETT